MTQIANETALNDDLNKLFDVAHANVVVMQVGSNNLCNAARSPEHVVDDLLRFASYLVERCGVKQVVVCQILQRNSCVHLRGQNLGTTTRRLTGLMHC